MGGFSEENQKFIAGPHKRRQKYQPTPADRATVQNLAAAGVVHEEIARCIGTKGIDDKTLRKHFRQELDTSATKIKALAMSKLVLGIQAGEAWAICFFLKCRAGWIDRQTVDFSGRVDVNVQSVQLLENRINSIVARGAEEAIIIDVVQ